MIPRAFAFLLLLQAWGAAAPVLVLPPQAEVSGSQVRLRDLVIAIEGAPAESLAAIVGAAPELGSGDIWDRSRIGAELRSRLGWAEVRFEGADAVRITRPAVDLPAVRLMELARARLQSQIGAAGRAEVLSADVELIRHPAEADAVEVDFPPGVLRQRRPVAEVTFLVDGHPVLVRQVRIEWRHLVPGLRSVRRLSRGEVLEGAVESVEIDALSHPGHWPFPEGGAAGLSELLASREIAAGAVLLKPDAMPRPLVRKGEPVAVLLELPSTVIRVQGVALGTGARGEMIEVMNPTTRRRFPAVVSGEGTASFQP